MAKNNQPDNSELEYTINYYLAGISGKSQAIYLIIIILFLISFISLPLIKVPVNVSGIGIIRPEDEKTIICSLVSGSVNQVHKKESDFIMSGEILLTLHAEQWNSELMLMRYMLHTLDQQINDLKRLIYGTTDSLNTDEYIKELDNFRKETAFLQDKLRKARKERERLESLYHLNLISDKEYDDLVYQQTLYEKEYSVLCSRYQKEWQTKLSGLLSEKQETVSKIKILEYNLSHAVIRSPVSGSIERFEGIFPGSNINSGIQIAVISPDSRLFGDIYLDPDKIGYIYEGQPVKLHLDAFNYREWGSVNSIITDLSDDFVQLNGQVVFRAKCPVEVKYLELKNGYKGFIKKGMTFRARIMITNRSLFQILFDRLEKWLEPPKPLKMDS